MPDWLWWVIGLGGFGIVSFAVIWWGLAGYALRFIAPLLDDDIWDANPKD